MSEQLTHDEYQELLRILECEITGIRKQKDAARKQNDKDGTFSILLEYAQSRLEELLPIKSKLVTLQAKHKSR